MQDNLIEIVNGTYEYSNDECLQIAYNYQNCIFSLKSNKEKKKICDEYLDNFLRCKTSQKHLLIQKSDR